ncbi:CpaF family protein [Salinibacillus xinjiangensis]|uniref:CpaF family protein n=1 Tax=Salinibacillus xinjiangensis TaxID=1229268 RepID=A0A6G1X493_9BACI|nr:CpaF family protein [Salinibacillus xinjiangensis]MRG85813.1 CpaF family protein [Salinibacillus xinjiangensis]
MSLLKRLNDKSEGQAASSSASKSSGVSIGKEGGRSPEHELKTLLRTHLISELRKFDEIDDDKQKEFLNKEAMSFLNQEGERLSFEMKKSFIEDISNELIGYGPITPFLNDPNVSEIMVNGPHDIYVENSGKLIKTQAYFRDHDHVLQVIEKIVSPLGRRIDESSPMVDARLPDGSRVNAIIPPLALNGPTITIRKFPQSRLQIENLINFGTLNENMAQFLDACVKARMNVFISGGTGSGKTTLLNVLSSFIPHDERIVTIEDAAELQLSQDHVISLETRPPNIEGTGAITIRDLVRNSLRMRPDRIVIGEVRSAEALDMLQAMNTGHDGSLATGHANSPRDMLSRLETMVLMAGMDLPVRAIREQVSGAIDIIIQQTRLKDGSRKITHISEITGMEGDTITLQDLFVFKQTDTSPDGKIVGKFVSTGIRPNCADKLIDYGIDVPSHWFEEEWS